MLQKDSEITFKAERPAGDANKLADYEHALAELKAAHTLFLQLARLDRRHNPIDTKKLETHQKYCEQAYLQGEVSNSLVCLSHVPCHRWAYMHASLVPVLKCVI